MSLFIAKPTPFGSIKATYWKVIQTEINWHAKLARVQLAGYVDEQSYKDKAQPIAVVQFEFHGERVFFNLGSNQVQFDCPFPFAADQPVVATAYNAIKKLETWDTAEDI